MGGRKDRGRRDDARSGRGGGPPPPPRVVLPTPVRQSMDASPPPPVDAVHPAEVTFEVDGSEVHARVEGRGRTGSGSGGAPLLLLSFVQVDGGGEELEAVVVGRTLEALSEAELAEAFRRGRPPRPPESRKPLFDDVVGRRSRGGR